MTARITAQQARKLGLGSALGIELSKEDKGKRSKYGNRKTTTEEDKFDSQREYRRFKALKIMERAGIIQDVKHHVVFVVIDPVHYPSINYDKQATKYEADFTYIRDGKLIAEDVKSEATITPLYKMKKQLMMEKHGIEVIEV